MQINHRGHVAFIGFNEATQVPFTIDDQGIWSDRNGVLAPVAIDRQPAPGIGGGVKLTAFREAVLNNADQVAYIGSLEGPGVTTDNSFGVWSEAMGGPRLVAREGDIAPGVSDGAVFRFFETLAINRWGQTAFYGSLGGTGVTSANDNGLWAETSDGTLRILVREGAAVEIAPGDTRTVQSLGFIGGPAGQDGRRSAFNDRGELVAFARFTNGSAAVLLWDDTFNLPGDYNANGTVDAADYVVWRKGLVDRFTQSDYAMWRTHFGETITSGSVFTAAATLDNSSDIAVPEPGAFWLLHIATAVLSGTRRCHRR